MKHYKVKKFDSDVSKALISDKRLIETFNDFLSLGKDGQQRYSLGAGLYKLRIATTSGRGKSGGSRSILAYKEGDKIIWLHCFAKNDKGNVTNKDLKQLKVLSNILLGLSTHEVSKLIKLGELIEVNQDD